jgi:hypothetical protein
MAAWQDSWDLGPHDTKTFHTVPLRILSRRESHALSSHEKIEGHIDLQMEILARSLDHITILVQFRYLFVQQKVKLLVFVAF